MSNTMNTTREQAASVAETKAPKDASKAEICFGAMMAIAAIAGLWGAVSLLISYFVQ